MKKRSIGFMFAFLLFCSTLMLHADNTNLSISVGKGSGYHQSTNGYTNNVIITEGIAVRYGTRTVPLIYVYASFTHPVQKTATVRAYQTVRIQASMSNPYHNHRLIDSGYDEY